MTIGANSIRDRPTVTSSETTFEREKLKAYLFRREN